MPVLALFLVSCGRGPATLPSDAPAPTPGPPIETPTPATPESPWVDSDRRVILVSLDGFRADYIERFSTPTLDRLVLEGVQADGLAPVFPSKTFPNHFTQVTGLYPSEHGIVGNSFFDEELGALFDMDETGPEWWGGEPIWITATNQGLRAATMFWPGSETPYDGVWQDEWSPYDGSVPNAARVDQVLDWMDEPVPPHFTTLYFSDVDTAGHAYGPDSIEVEAAVGLVDSQLGLLVDGLEARGMLDAVDLVVVSDHGMAELSRERAIFLDDFVDIDQFWINAWGPYVTLDPMDGDATGVLEQLDLMPHATCSDGATRPPELHFPAGPRIPEILCVAELGWGITSRLWFDSHPDDLTGSTHGWQSDAPEMHGLFVARGPHLEPGVTHPAFSSIHLYALFAELLQVEPAPNSGDPDVVAPLVRSDPEGAP